MADALRAPGSPVFLRLKIYSFEAEESRLFRLTWKVIFSGSGCRLCAKALSQSPGIAKGSEAIAWQPDA